MRINASKCLKVVHMVCAHYFMEVKEMLILTRRIGETLMVGDDVAITVLGVKGNQIRLGVDAPKDVSVHREEIYQRIQRERDMGNERLI